MDPDQTAPPGAVRSGSTLFDKEAAKTIQQTRKQTTFVVIGALGVKGCVLLDCIYPENTSN